MKTEFKYSQLSLLLWLALLTPVWFGNEAFASSCTSGRTHTQKDCGCPKSNYPGLGGLTPPCGCTPTHGMPSWDVTEPYIDLWLSDTPLSYTMSSGKEMEFSFYYRTGYKIPDVDEVPDFYYQNGTYNPHNAGDDYFTYARSGPMADADAAWSHSWMKDIIFWDSQFENQWDNGHGVPVTRPVFEDGYEALVFGSKGDVQYYYSTNNNAQVSLQEPRSQSILQPLSTLGYPTVNTPVEDTNGIFWGDTQTNGFQMAYPDGSKEVFGLCYYPVSSYYVEHLNSYTGSHAFLTQRIDPQGRVTRIGYELVDNNSSFRVKYVVDPDGRTNTFFYQTNNPALADLTDINPWTLAEIDDPYGRKVQLGYVPRFDSVYNAGSHIYQPSPHSFEYPVLTSLTDAAGNTSSFQYNASFITNSYLLASGLGYSNIISYAYLPIGPVTNMTTPYGNTSFGYFEIDDGTISPGTYVEQKAIYVSEPEDAHQLYYYRHEGIDTNNNPLLATTAVSPTGVPGVSSFDDGTTGSPDATLNFRNSMYWGRLQFPSLSAPVRSLLDSSISNAVALLTTNDFRKGRARHWLWESDQVSTSESLSSERDPSPDTAGLIEGERTWYGYSSKPNAAQVGADPQITCTANLLPDGSSQYTACNFYAISPGNSFGFVSSTESSYSNPNGTIGILTNWITYAGNGIDVAKISNSAGQWVSYTYDGNHDVLTITNALRQGASLSWDGIDGGETWNLTGIQWADGETAVLNLDLSGSRDTNGVFVPGPNYGFTTGITWSPSGRSFTYNNYYAGIPSNITDDRGVTVLNSYDGLNRLSGSTFPDGTTISNVYNRLDLAAAKDRLNNWNYYAYDGLQHLVAFTNANDAVYTYSWCGCGSLTGIYDPNNDATAFTYDNQGNLIGTLFPDYSSVSRGYDLLGRITNATDGGGHSFLFGYNDQGQVTTVSNVFGLVRQTIYDAVNRPSVVTDANGVVVSNSYDAINELLQRTWTDGHTENYGYSPQGLMALTNRDGRVTLYGRDNASRLTASTNANHEVNLYSYDSLNNVINLTDGANHVTHWQYNEYGWLTNKVDGNGANILRLAYDANGRMINRFTLEKGATAYGYDAVGNLTQITYPRSAITYAYDTLNRLTSMVDAAGTTTFGYTPASELQSETGPWANDAVTNGYTQQLRTVLGLAQPGGSWTQAYTYDAAARLTNVFSPAGSFGYQLGAMGPASPLISALSLPNGGSITNGYDSLARLTETALNNHSGVTLDGYGYQYDALGWRTNVTRNFGSATSSAAATYDAIGQLTNWVAQESGGAPRLNEQLAWGYDSADNLHNRANNALAESFTVDAANQLTGLSRSGTLTVAGNTLSAAASVTVDGRSAVTYADLTFAGTNNVLTNGLNSFTTIAQNSSGSQVTNILTLNLPASITLVYDANGNLTNDGLKSFGYDMENQLTNIALPGQWRSAFAYDGLGRRRIERDFAWQAGAWVQTNEVHYIYDGALILQERDQNNHVLVTYTRGRDLGGGIQTAGGIGGLLARVDASTTNFYHADGSGNITALVNASNNVVARYLYNPFGQVEGKWGPLADANEMQFSSMPHHNLSGLSLYLCRAYDPHLQRWLNHDPLQELGGINLYRFGGNGPVNNVDNNGEFVLSLGFLIYDMASALYDAATDKSTTADDAFVALDAGALGLDLISGGTAGEVAEAASLGARVAARAAEIGANITKADAALALLHVPHIVNNLQNPNSGKPSGPTYCPTRTLKDPLPRNPKKPTEADPHAPDPAATGPHTVVGTRTEPKKSPEPYTQGITYDANGNPIGRIDVTDHGRGDHDDPHWHPYDPTAPNAFDRENPGNFGKNGPIPH